jgi:hypothetical protein
VAAWAGAAEGPEGLALAALEHEAGELLKLFRNAAARFAARLTTTTRRRKKPSDETSLLTPPQLAKQLGVHPDKIHAWIRSGELHATNIAATLSDQPGGH